jgi:hypothetical protein
MIADLYLVTWQRDLCWLPYLFRSIVKHVRGFRKLHVVVPVICDLPESVKIIERSGMEVVGGTIQPWLNTYVGQGAAKLMAWQRCDADAVCYLDSDLLFTREFRPESMLTNGRFRIEYRPWEEAGAAQCWREGTRRLLRAEPPIEAMQRHPFMYPTMTIRRAYHHVGGEMGYMDAHAPSEFNLLGNYAYLHERDAFEFLSYDEGAAERAFVRAFWTHGGITPAVEAELKAHGFWED